MFLLFCLYEKIVETGKTVEYTWPLRAPST